MLALNISRDTSQVRWLRELQPCMATSESEAVHLDTFVPQRPGSFLECNPNTVWYSHMPHTNLMLPVCVALHTLSGAVGGLFP
jgi:hypothetical protein